jgi:F1F0 ATPase subunit 2
MVTEVIETMLAIPFGFALGSLYFWGLWQTTQQLTLTRAPLRLFLASYFGRLTLAGLGFYWLAQGGWVNVLVGLLGFLIARSLLIRRWEPKPYQEEN